MENLRFWSSSRSQRLALSCGKRHIHQQNYTLSSWHWDYYCLLSTSLVPLKCWYKLTAAPLKGKKRESMGQGKGIYRTAQQPPADWRRIVPEGAKQPLSGSLQTTKLSRITFYSCSSVGPRTRSSPAVVTSQHCSSMENDIKRPAFRARDFICHEFGSRT